jgi:7-cyano-7-deazaguanine synthase
VIDFTQLRVMVLLSGGIDSSACVDYYLSHGYDVSALFVHYGQPYQNEERAAAKAIAQYYSTPLNELRVSGRSVPSGYIPARNAMLLSLAMFSFEGEKGIISLGIHSGTEYVDCSPDFIVSMQAVYDLYEQGRIRIDAPFLHWTKGEIIEYAQMQGVPLHLTHSSNPLDLPLSLQDGTKK